MQRNTAVPVIEAPLEHFEQICNRVRTKEVGYRRAVYMRALAVELDTDVSLFEPLYLVPSHFRHIVQQQRAALEAIEASATAAALSPAAVEALYGQRYSALFLRDVGKQVIPRRYEQERVARTGDFKRCNATGCEAILRDRATGRRPELEDLLADLTRWVPAQVTGLAEDVPHTPAECPALTSYTAGRSVDRRVAAAIARKAREVAGEIKYDDTDSRDPVEADYAKRCADARREIAAIAALAKIVAEEDHGEKSDAAWVDLQKMSESLAATMRLLRDAWKRIMASREQASADRARARVLARSGSST